MPQYNPPLRDMQFVMHEVLNVVDELKTLPAHAEIDADTINAVLEEGGKFASQVVFPLNISGDEEGCTLDKSTHEVTAPKGFKEAYQQYVEGGWPALSCDPEYGGQGLPHVVNQSFYEMLNSANQAWTMYPGLSHGAYEALHAHGTPEQKQLYLPKLVSGVWTGTMCLTEPHCGTDLGLLRTKAEPQANGTYKLSGQKIFISAGEHDLAENIVHLVLARLPDAPAGSKGISLFVVPKFKVKADGSLGERNPIYCGGLEHKMGIHGNATAQMILDGAEGSLVGEPNKGLAAMFVMMNAARLLVGVQGLGHLEMARQNAWRYARERHQSRAPGHREGPSPLAEHPAMRRTLWRLEALAQGQRLLAMATALWLDEAEHHVEPALRGRARRLLELLTPVVKAFLTDTAHQAVNAALQVWGGHGYLRDHGIEQAVRDSRIAMIYEGSNEIQAIDLLQRKLFEDGCHRFAEAMGVVDQELEAARAEPVLADCPEMKPLVHGLQLQVDALREATARLYVGRQDDPTWAYRVADDYLHAFGWVLMGWAWLRTARFAAPRRTDPWYATQFDAARYGLEWLLPEAGWRLQQVGRRDAILPAPWQG